MKILAVCGFGVGSSMVLKMTIDKVARELGITADVENTDISSAKAMHADVIFTSNELLNELKSSVTAPVYAVKKYMDVSEVKEKLQDYLSSKGE